MADKAASQVNASYGKMNAGYIKSAYHKEDVNHPKPLSIIRSNKLSGDALEEAYDMNEKMVMCEQCGKMHEEGACGEMKENKMLGNMDTALASLSKKPEYKKISKNLMSLSKRAAERDKAAPKQLKTQLASLASKVDKKAGAALMKMSKLAGTYESVEEGINESEIHLDAKHDTFKKIKKSKWAAIKKKYNVTIDSDSTGSWAGGKPADLHKFAMAMGMSKDDIKKTYNHITPDYKGASHIKNRQREEVEEAKEKKLSPTMKNNIHKIAKKHAGDMEAAMKEISMMKVWKGQGIKDHPYVMDALKRANETYDYGSDKAVKAAKKKTPGQKNEAMSKGQMAHDKEFMHKKLKGNNNKAMHITTANKLDGVRINGRSVEWSSKVDKLLSKHKVTIRNDGDGDISVWGKGDDVHKFLSAMGQRVEANESVDVDRRTKGFKEAMKRAEAAKKKREAYKKKKEAKKDQAELDARYDYDGEVDTILAAASKVMMGTNETAANAVAHGGVDMAPNAGKKKKKELLARRGY